MKLFEPQYEQLEAMSMMMDTQAYLKMWTHYHSDLWKMGQDYVESIRQAQQAASLKAIKEVIS